MNVLKACLLISDGVNLLPYQAVIVIITIANIATNDISY